MSDAAMAKSDLKIPQFATEAEEAKWWFENEELIANEFEKAAKEGRLGRGSVRQLLAERGVQLPEPKSVPTPTTTIRLDPDDIAKARVQAAERGLRYQTYLKMIIHEALRSAENAPKTATR